MLNEDFSAWCVKLKQLSHLKRWRSLLVLVGDKAWTSQYVDVSLKTFLSDHRAKAMPNKNGLIYGNIDNMV